MKLDFSIITEHNHNVSKAVCFHLQVKMKTKENCFQNVVSVCVQWWWINCRYIL